MLKHYFSTKNKLINLIDDYFDWIEQANNANAAACLDDNVAISRSKKATANGDVNAPTITGLALHLGFNSLDEFYKYMADGPFSGILKRGHLRVEASYEKKLHQNQPHTGVIFALKNMGWSEKRSNVSGVDKEVISVVKIEITGLESAPGLAAIEGEVVL